MRRNRLAFTLRAVLILLAAAVGYAFFEDRGLFVGGVLGALAPDAVFLLLAPWRQYKPLTPRCANGRCVGEAQYVPVAFNQSALGIRQRPEIPMDGFVLRCQCGLEHFNPGKPFFRRWDWYAIDGSGLRLLATARPFHGWQQNDPQVAAPLR